MALVLNSIGANLIDGCCYEAERAETVGQNLESLRQALPEKLHAHLTLLVAEVYKTCHILRDLTDLSQIHIARVSLVTKYINVVLPCLAKTLNDMDGHYKDKTKTRERRWRSMYHEMSNELPGTTLPARFVLYCQFLDLLRMMLTKSPNFDINALESFRNRILQLREAREIPRPNPMERSPVLWDETFEHDTHSHWAESIFARPLPRRTKLDKPKNPTSQALGPFRRLGQPVMSRDTKCLVRRSFNNERLSVTFFLQSSDEAPYVLIRTVQDEQPWVSLYGAHELCISRHDNATLNFTRWSQTEDHSKIWASLKFSIWEEMVLFYCTFVCLKARSVRLVNLHHREYTIRNEEKLFQATIMDDGYIHSLAVHKDPYTGRHRLHATIYEGTMQGCPVWTAFLSGKSVPPWLTPKGRHRVWIRGIQPYVFCETYNANNQRRGRHGDFQLHFMKEEAATRFVEVFDPPASSVGPAQ